MKVYELLASPEAWIQDAWARDANGNSCSSSSPEAVCWCLSGAVNRCYSGEWLQYKKVEAEIGTPYSWNDRPGRTHAEVVELCRKLDI